MYISQSALLEELACKLYRTESQGFSKVLRHQHGLLQLGFGEYRDSGIYCQDIWIPQA
jgi:hypothetical protein